MGCVSLRGRAGLFVNVAVESQVLENQQTNSLDGGKNMEKHS